MKRSALALSLPGSRVCFCTAPMPSGRLGRDSAVRRRRLRTLGRLLSLLLVALWTVSSLCLIHARQQERRHASLQIVAQQPAEP